MATALSAKTPSKSALKKLALVAAAIHPPPPHGGLRKVVLVRPVVNEIRPVFRLTRHSRCKSEDIPAAVVLLLALVSAALEVGGLAASRPINCD